MLYTYMYIYIYIYTQTDVCMYILPGSTDAHTEKEKGRPGALCTFCHPCIETDTINHIIET